MKKDPNIKTMSIRIPKDIWEFLRKRSFDQLISMNEIIISRLEKYKNKCENKLT